MRVAAAVLAILSLLIAGLYPLGLASGPVPLTLAVVVGAVAIVLLGVHALSRSRPS